MKKVYTLHGLRENDEEVNKGNFKSHEDADAWANENGCIEYIITDDEPEYSDDAA